MRTAIWTLTAVSMLPATAAADELLDRLSAASWPEPQACDATARMVEGDGETRVVRAWRLDAETGTSVMIEGPEEELAQANEGADDVEETEDEDGSVSAGPPSHAEASAVAGYGYARQPDQGGLAVYVSETLPKGAFEMDGRDMSKRAEATLYVDDAGERPLVARRVMALRKPWRIPMIAKVRELRMDTRYEVVGSAPRPVAMTVRFDADAMGKSQSGEVAMAMTDFDCPAQDADMPAP